MYSALCLITADSRLSPAPAQPTLVHFSLSFIQFISVVADETYQKLQLKLFAMNQLLLGF